MAKFIKCEEHGWKGVYLFQCPGCGCAHYVNTIKGGIHAGISTEM